ncbi:AmmeMemoRadiSam system protein A [Oceanirhabdus sp. W0125-5]|uniref:AmmeMemoRadiSam system protein A n=1 Tax=Oceanirhabdus sp. W0125-5 TaxID=2999116 RepID=UPI0022F32554|nr:AmmeMemoRadiSam system protein A [Oceanirhabdus sp. W0125-5]WBW96161.1 AmmeMemoRadiSam system protein A [Oceanirhabdus sp. W0125-5]
MGKILGHYILPHPPIIIPEVGMGNQHVAFRTTSSMKMIANEISIHKPDNIVVISPHGPSFTDGISIMDSYFIEGNFKEFGSDLSMEKEINKKLVEELKNRTSESNIPLITLDHSNAELYNIEYKLDHGTMVPLYFIDKFINNYKLTTITYGGISKLQHYKFGMQLKEAISNIPGNFIIISSGDLSHKLIEDSPYGYDSAGELFDRTLINHLVNGNWEDIILMDDDLVTNACQCALKSIIILLGTLDEFDFKSDMISYEHPFGVGYCISRINIINNCESKYTKLERTFERRFLSMIKKESFQVNLAREAITNFIKYENYIDIPSNTPKELLWNKKGVFVSLKIDGDLRGCIGTITPTCDTTCEEIIRNAIEACSHDPRFTPVYEEELQLLSITVDILESPEHCSKADLDPKKYGIIVSTETKKAVLLPNLPGINTVEEQLTTVLKKAGINPDEKYLMERFEVKRYH